MFYIFFYHAIFLYYVFTFNLFDWIFTLHNLIITTRVHMHTCTKSHTRELKCLNTWTNTQYPFSYKNIVFQIINISSSAHHHVFFRNFLIVFVNMCKPEYRTLYITCFLYNYVTCLPTVSMTYRDTCFSIYAISTDYMHPLVHDIKNNLYRILYLNLLHV